MKGPPPQYTAKTLDDYLEQLSKPVFQAGMSWAVVDAKWPTTTKAFHGFKVERVARMSEREVDALTKDERVIRSRPKIAAVVHNANALLEIERAGGFKRHPLPLDREAPGPGMARVGEGPRDARGPQDGAASATEASRLTLRLSAASTRR